MKQFVKAVAITTFLSIATRALGLLIKIYISREIGAEALGFYQISLSAFFLLCTLVTSGIPLVLSKQIATTPKNKPSIVFSGLVLSSSIAVVVCGITFMIPSAFISVWGQPNSLHVLYTLLPAVIFTAVYVPFRGGFWGSKNFFLLGFTELLEQLIRFAACIIMFSLPLVIPGEIIAGTTYTIACALSSIIAIIIYFAIGNRLKFSTNHILPLLKESSPIAAVRIGSSLVTMLVSILLPLKLAQSGLSQSAAVSEFGVVSGMVIPLLTIPGTLISSIAIALTPEISGKNEEYLSKQVNRSISFSIIISFTLFPLFLTLGKPIGQFLYGDKLSGELLQAGSFLLLPLGISQISSSIINAIGKEKQGLLNYCIGTACMLFCIWVLPKYIGIYSLLAGFMSMTIIQSILNLRIIEKLLNSTPLKTLFASILYCVPSALVSMFSFNILKTFLPLSLSLFISGSTSILILLTLYQLFKFIDIKDYLPKKLPAAHKI